MPTGRVTKRSVDAMPEGSANAFLWDDDLRGFGLKVTPAGHKSYVYQYRVGGREAKTRRWTIGPHGSPWTPDTARAEAKRLSTLVRQGIDPIAADEAKRREAVDLDFKTYAERFITEYLMIEWKGGWELAAGLLRREAVPAFKGKSLRDIKRSDVSAFLDRMSDRPAARRNAFAAVRRLFRWAVNRGDIPDSPIRDMDAPAAPASRDRVLTDEEIVCVWLAADEIDFPYGPMVRLLMLTGQRREEVSALDWSELHQSSVTWTLPAARAKNGITHDVPLSDQAVAVIDGLAARLKRSDGKWPRRGFVFTGETEKAVRGYSVAKRRLDREVNKARVSRALGRGESAEGPCPAWRFHDLRRTLATGLQRLGVRFEVTEAVLNHLSGSKGGVAGVYQRHNWAGEKRAALAAWGEWVEHRTDGADSVSNVVPIAAARS